jgi:hypothetical protein
MTAKQKHIMYRVQSFKFKLLLQHSLQFLMRQKLLLFLFPTGGPVEEKMPVIPLGGIGYPNNFLEIDNIFGRGFI